MFRLTATARSVYVHRSASPLAHAGAQLLYHGDFDWPCLRIGNYMMCAYGAQPWRFGAADYAVRTSPLPGRRLDGAEALASWGARLASAMQGYQLAIAEESVGSTVGCVVMMP
jgi:uncharacterized protein (TIGR02679 family)